VLSLFARLSGIPDGVIQYVLDDAPRVPAGGGTRMTCNGTLPPMELVEYCAYQLPGGQSEMHRGCPSPYEAYKQWCAPLVCQELDRKPPYIQAMQIMAAIGGIYSIMTMFIIGVLWRLFVLVMDCSNGSAPKLQSP
jgi:hypothetical protein